MKTNKKNIIFNYWYKLIIVLISIITILCLSFFDLDKKGEKVVNESLKEAIIVFGVAKGLNAAISLAQGTEIGPPGVTISIGEVLDPINDLIERFSWVMLASITSLGIQKIFMNFVTADTFSFLVIFLIILSNILLFTKFKDFPKIKTVLLKITLLMLFFRLSIPIMSLLNSYAYINFVKKDYDIEKSKNIIDKSSSDINNIAKSTTKDEKKGFFSSISKVFDADFYRSKVEEYKIATEKLSKYILNLIIAFTFKAIIFPLLFLFILYQLMKALFRVSKE